MNAHQNIRHAKQSVENGINSLKFAHRHLETTSKVANSDQPHKICQIIEQVLEGLSAELEYADMHLEQAFKGVYRDRFQSN